MQSYINIIINSYLYLKFLKARKQLRMFSELAGKVRERYDCYKTVSKVLEKVHVEIEITVDTSRLGKVNEQCHCRCDANSRFTMFNCDPNSSTPLFLPIVN